MEKTSGALPLFDRITRAAITLFSANGYHGTSTRDIARVAQVSEVTLFRHFQTKEELFLSALRTSFVPIHAKRKNLRRGGHGEAPEQTLREVLTLFVDMVSYHPESVRLSAVAL